MRTISLHLLGGFEIRTADGVVLSLPTPKYRALLAFLASPAGRRHARATLIALLWGELPHEPARAALRQALWALRRALNGSGATAIVLDGDHVALDAATVRVDVAEFEAAAAPNAASAARAADLYRGAFLMGLSAREAPFEEWLATERERLAERALSALARLLAAQRAEGTLEHAVQTALRLLALDPLQEVVHRSLMQLYVQLGRRGAALRQYQSCVAVLRRELGVDPEPETRELYQRIVRQRGSDPGPGAAPRRVARSPVTPPDTPLVGRDPELAALRGALDSVTATGGRVVGVVGDAGIGKSRLVAELLAEAAAAGARTLIGRAYESDRAIPLGPWADALRRARLRDDPALLAALPPACLPDIARLVPELGWPVPATAHGAHDSVALFQGVVALLSGMAARSPLVLVLEDLHWADDMSLRLLSFVARQLDALHAMLLVTVRAEELDGSPVQRVLDDLGPDVATLALERLGRDDTLRLVRAMDPGRHGTDADGLGERVWAASGGHPFVVVEMAREAGHTAPLDPLQAVAVPERVRALVEHRFGLLGAPARQVVAAAAVIGRDFTYALLQRAAGLDEDVALAALEELVRRRVVHAVGERFEFTHDHLREVARAALLPPRRKLLHRRIAEALDSLAGDGLVEEHAAVGDHYAHAEVWDRAAQRLYEAAQAAYNRTAYREAAGMLERALGALARLSRTRAVDLLEIDIRLRLFRCLNPLGDPEAAAHVARAHALVAEAPDDAREAAILVEIAELRRFARDLSGAVAAGDRALMLAERAGQARLRAQAHFQLGVAHLTRGARREGVAHLQSTVASLAEAPLRDRLGYPYVTALTRLAWSFADIGELGESRRYATDAARVAEQSPHAVTMAEASIAAGVLHLAEGSPAEAIAPLERALAVARAGHIHVRPRVQRVVARLAHARCGHDREARALLDECEERRVWEHVRLEWSRIIARLAEARHRVGDERRAQALAEDALRLARAVGEPAGEADALGVLDRITTRGAPRSAPA